MDLTEWDPLKLALESPNFCILPWTHQYIHTDGEVRGCCVYEGKYGSLKENSLEEIWNNENTRKTRISLLNGIFPTTCRACDKMETIGNGSLATTSNRWLFSKPEDIDPATEKHKFDILDLVASTTTDGHVKEHKLYYMDTRFNNLCNYSCRPCNHSYSTSWIKDEIKLRRAITKLNQYQMVFSGKTETDALEQITPHLSIVKKVYFAGGEPMMQEDHYKVLEELIRIGRTDVEIRYNTNFSRLTLGDRNVVELWKQFNSVEISASLDASYEKAEYWRNGTDWKQILNNVDTIKKEVPHVKLSITSSTAWPNVYSAMELNKEWVTLGLLNIKHFHCNYVHFPMEYTLSNLPVWKKELIKTDIQKHCEWIKDNGGNDNAVKEWTNIINLMMIPSKIPSDVVKVFFEKKTNQLDEMRRQDFWSTFPEHHDLKEFWRI